MDRPRRTRKAPKVYEAELPSRRSNWTLQDKEKLLEAIKKHGKDNLAKLDKAMKPKKTRKQIADYIQQLQNRRIDNTDVATEQEAPIETWLQLTNELTANDADYSDLLSNVTSVCANLEPHFPSRSPREADYTAIYRYMACLLRGEEELPKLGALSAGILLDVMQSLADTLETQDLSVQRHLMAEKYKLLRYKAKANNQHHREATRKALENDIEMDGLMMVSETIPYPHQVPGRIPSIRPWNRFHPTPSAPLPDSILLGDSNATSSIVSGSSTAASSVVPGNSTATSSIVPGSSTAASSTASGNSTVASSSSSGSSTAANSITSSSTAVASSIISGSSSATSSITSESSTVTSSNVSGNSTVASSIVSGSFTATSSIVSGSSTAASSVIPENSTATGSIVPGSSTMTGSTASGNSAVASSTTSGNSTVASSIVTGSSSATSSTVSRNSTVTSSTVSRNSTVTSSITSESSTVASSASKSSTATGSIVSGNSTAASSTVPGSSITLSMLTAPPATNIPQRPATPSHNISIAGAANTSLLPPSAKRLKLSPGMKLMPGSYQLSQADLQNLMKSLGQSGLRIQAKVAPKPSMPNSATPVGQCCGQQSGVQLVAQHGHESVCQDGANQPSVSCVENGPRDATRNPGRPRSAIKCIRHAVNLQPRIQNSAERTIQTGSQGGAQGGAQTEQQGTVHVGTAPQVGDTAGSANNTSDEGINMLDKVVLSATPEHQRTGRNANSTLPRRTQLFSLNPLCIPVRYLKPRKKTNVPGPHAAHQPPNP